MAVTPNLNLYLPDDDDYVSNERDLNDNFEKIDSALGVSLRTGATFNNPALNDYDVSFYEFGKFILCTGFINPKLSGQNLLLIGNIPVPANGKQVIFPVCSNTGNASGWGAINSNSDNIKFTLPAANVPYGFNFIYVRS